jgi:hypothetical protein
MKVLRALVVCVCIALVFNIFVSVTGWFVIDEIKENIRQHEICSEMSSLEGDQ